MSLLAACVSGRVRAGGLAGILLSPAGMGEVAGNSADFGDLSGEREAVGFLGRF